MRVLGIVLQKNYLRFAVLEGTQQLPILFEKGRQATSDPNDTAKLMDWFDTHFKHLINNYKPDKIAYKLSLDLTMDQQHNLSYPLGLLNLTAHQASIPIFEFSSRGITPSKLGLTQATDLTAHVNSFFGSHPPHWDKYQHEAILVAWFCL